MAEHDVLVVGIKSIAVIDPAGGVEGLRKVLGVCGKNSAASRSLASHRESVRARETAFGCIRYLGSDHADLASWRLPRPNSRQERGCAPGGSAELGAIEPRRGRVPARGLAGNCRRTR